MNAIHEEVVATAERAVAALQERAGGRLDGTVASLKVVDKLKGCSKKVETFLGRLPRR